MRQARHDCANAVGAAIARVSGEAEQVFRDLARDEAIAAALEIAERKAINAGANRGSRDRGYADRGQFTARPRPGCRRAQPDRSQPGGRLSDGSH
jgi:hypothetical protein